METLGNLHTREWLTLEKIRRSIGMPEAAYADLLGLTSKEMKNLRARGGSVPVTSVMNLMEELHISFENVMTGKLDYRAIAANYGQNLDILPIKYQLAAFSRVRTSQHYIKYLRNQGLHDLLNESLRQLQVHEEAIENSDSAVSILFLNDLSHYLVKRGFSKGSLFSMATYSVDYSQDTPMGRMMGAHIKVKSLYEQVVTEMMHLFDQNCSYSIEKLSSQHIEVKVVQNEKVKEALKESCFGSDLLCINRAAMGSVFPKYMGLPASIVKESKCIYRGDNHCMFHFDFLLSSRLLAFPRPNKIIH